uniref:Uncharacterized protein n=1 Tax=Glycine max TaxID=3847 RepID=A0A0R0KWL7_SOYBN
MDPVSVGTLTSLLLSSISASSTRLNFHALVRSTLENFFLNSKEELYLLQIDAKKVCNHFSMLFNGLGFDCDSWKN